MLRGWLVLEVEMRSGYFGSRVGLGRKEEGQDLEEGVESGASYGYRRFRTVWCTCSGRFLPRPHEVHRFQIRFFVVDVHMRKVLPIQFLGL